MTGATLGSVKSPGSAGVSSVLVGLAHALEVPVDTLLVSAARHRAPHLALDPERATAVQGVVSLPDREQRLVVALLRAYLAARDDTAGQT